MRTRDLVKLVALKETDIPGVRAGTTESLSTSVLR